MDVFEMGAMTAFVDFCICFVVIQSSWLISVDEDFVAFLQLTTNSD